MDKRGKVTPTLETGGLATTGTARRLLNPEAQQHKRRSILGDTSATQTSAVTPNHLDFSAKWTQVTYKGCKEGEDKGWVGQGKKHLELNKIGYILTNIS